MMRPLVDRPNILIISAHDLGRHVRALGQPTDSTPHLDRFAREAFSFDRCFAVAPTCSPSRAGLFTGRWPHSTGVMGLTHGNFAWGMHPGEQHLAAILSTAGYHRACYGVAHEEQAPLGFSEFRPFTETFRPTGPELAGMAAEFFERQRQASEQPWFLHIGLFEPHAPFDFGGVSPIAASEVSVPAFLEDTPAVRSELAAYEGAIRVMDAAFGRIVDALETTGPAENTLVLFTTDHGIPFPRAKASLYDRGLELACLLRWPRGGWGPGCSDALCSNIDLLPTLLEAAGIPVPKKVQGRSLVQILQGSEVQSPNRVIFAEQTYHGGSLFLDPRRCLRTDTHKLIVSFTTSALWPADAEWMVSPQVRQAVFEASQHGTAPYIECYDLVADPDELHNLAAVPEPPAIIAALRRELLRVDGRN